MGWAPAIRDLCEPLGLKSTAIHYQISQLAEAGFVAKRAKTARSVCLTLKGQQWLEQEETRERRSIDAA
jgi:predicted transcriptional regulator